MVERAQPPTPKPPEFREIEYLPSGSHMLDLVLGGGWARGRVVNIVGDKSSGKCGRDFFVLSKEHGLLYSDEIGDQQPEGQSELSYNLALDNRKSVQSSHFWKETVSTTFRLKTSHGFEFKGTSKHKLKVVDETLSFAMRPMLNIKVGDYAVIAYDMGVFGDDYVELPQEGLRFPMSVKRVLPFVGALLGHFAAAGHFTKTDNCEIVCARWDHIEDSVRKAAELTLGKDSCRFNYEGAVFSNSIKPLLYQLFGEDVAAEDRRVPQAVLRSPKDVQVAFLAAVFVHAKIKDESKLVFKHRGRMLMRQMHMMLLNLGIIGKLITDVTDTLNGDVNTVYYLELEGNPLDKFLELAWTWEGFGLQKDMTLQLDAETNEERLVNNSKTTYFFDQFVEKRKLEHPGQEVYDFHVPDGHRYWASGFVSHNTMLAVEACANFARQQKSMDNIRYVEAESAFNEAYADSIGMPRGIVPVTGINTIEEFYKDLQGFLASKKKGAALDVLDSLDALSDTAELERDIDKGGYGMAKAKLLSELFRRLVREIEAAETTLFVISQIRDNVGMFVGAKHIRSGGKALDFYASQILWLKLKKRITKTVRGIEVVIGAVVEAKTHKNKVGMPFRECDLTILFNYGIDDEETMLSWIEQAKAADELSASPKQIRDDLKKARSNRDKAIIGDIRDELIRVSTAEWNKIEAALQPPMRKYGD